MRLRKRYEFHPGGGRKRPRSTAVPSEFRNGGVFADEQVFDAGFGKVLNVFRGHAWLNPV